MIVCEIVVITYANSVVGVGPSVCLSVCLFVRSITQKRKIPKCSNLVYGMTLGYPRNDMVFVFQVTDYEIRVRQA